MSLRVFVSGQRSFGAAAAATVLAEGHRLVGVASPTHHPSGRPDALYVAAATRGDPWTDAVLLRPPDVPAGTDVIVAAHSHAYLGARTRARARLAVGYHPSLLPLHRGRNAVRWTIRDRDRVAGGSVYHLTDRIDGGPLAAQGLVLVPPGATAADLWRDLLFPLGLELLARVLTDVAAGTVAYVPQDEACATWEPSWERPQLHRPELPELPAGPTVNGLRFTARLADSRGAT